MDDFAALAGRIRTWGRELGFQQIGVAGIELREDEARLRDWLAEGRHGTMDYMARHGSKRSRPDELVPGTLRVVSARMDYGTGDDTAAWRTLADGERAYVARYALGRDYHKVLRARLQKLADRIAADAGPFGYRVFTDSAPVLERALARDAGLGWIGKHTCLIDRDAGSWFFLGEIYTDLPLPVDLPATAHCGTCTRCIDICPTGAIVAPNQVDARRCISYLTIELKESIPEDLRPLIGNRVFGCDDCQLACPWNKFAVRHDQGDFAVRNDLDRASLAEPSVRCRNSASVHANSSAIRRTGYAGWLRNIAVALGNAPTTPAVLSALAARREHADAMVREPVLWAQAQHPKQAGSG